MFLKVIVLGFTFNNNTLCYGDEITIYYCLWWWGAQWSESVFYVCNKMKREGSIFMSRLLLLLLSKILRFTFLYIVLLLPLSSLRKLGYLPWNRSSIRCWSCHITFFWMNVEGSDQSSFENKMVLFLGAIFSSYHHPKSWREKHLNSLKSGSRFCFSYPLLASLLTSFYDGV